MKDERPVRMAESDRPTMENEEEFGEMTIRHHLIHIGHVLVDVSEALKRIEKKL